MNSKKITDPCEWNPEANRSALRNEAHAAADWIVGANGAWRVCDACAKLPRFRRLRKRIPIQRKVKEGSSER